MNTQNTNRKRRRAPRPEMVGLTLIEILVVVTILGIIASIVGVAVANQLEEAKVDAAKIQLSELAKNLDLYKVKFHRYPTTQEGLQAMVHPPEGKKPIMESIPKDPWDADYIFVSPGTHNPGKFDIQSKGPDGVADSEDDVKNW
jgi:general secretion pathway protein G